MEMDRVLEAFRNCITDPKCKNCQRKECVELKNKKIEIPADLALTAEALIVELMKKQQPVEIEREGDNHCWWFVCEECHGMVDDNDSYCRHCGRPFRKKVQRDA